jgi:hypothetical protein
LGAITIQIATGQSTSLITVSVCYNCCCAFDTQSSSFCISDLTLKQLERPVVSFIDYDLHEEPVNAKVTKALHRLNKTWMQHSIQATGDPFTRINPPWLTNTSDFAATSAEARKVLHEPLPLHDIGLGGLFGEFFDRSEVGRRDMFRDGDPSTVAAALRFHFEDNDRVRGLTVTASLRLIATDEFLMGEGGAWVVFRNVNFNTNPDSVHDKDGIRMSDVVVVKDVNVSVTVRDQTNAHGACGDTIDASAPTTGPATLPLSSSPGSCSNFTVANTNLNEDHIAALKDITTADDCCSACRNQSGCLYYTSSPPMCYLKAEWDGVEWEKGAISGGIVPPRPPPPVKPLYS